MTFDIIAISVSQRHNLPPGSQMRRYFYTPSMREGMVVCKEAGGGMEWIHMLHSNREGIVTIMIHNVGIVFFSLAAPHQTLPEINQTMLISRLKSHGKQCLLFDFCSTRTIEELFIEEVPRWSTNCCHLGRCLTFAA